MSDETPPAGGFAFAPAPTKPPQTKRQIGKDPALAAPYKTRDPYVDVAASIKRRRRTRAELEAAGTKPKRKAVDADTSILKVCVKQLRKADDPARIVATLRIMFE